MRFTKLWSWLPGPESSRSQGRGRRCRPALLSLEDRTVPNGYIAVGAGPGALPVVSIRVDIRNAFTGSIPVGVGQVTPPLSDGQTDLTSDVFLAYNPAFLGGVHVAAGNFDGDYTTPDSLVTAPGAGGGPDLIVWRTVQQADGQIKVAGKLAEFNAYDPRFTGGVNVTTGDVDGDGRSELIVGAGPGGGPHVRIFKFDVSDQRFVLVNEFMAYDPNFRGGVSVASNTGYATPVQVRQVLNAQLPAGFNTVPYNPPSSAPGASANPNLNFPLVGISNTLDTNGQPLPYITVASGPIQYVGGNLLGNLGNLVYQPNILGQPLVFAMWAANDPNLPAFAAPGTIYGPFVQTGTAGSTPIITRLRAPAGQPTVRDQLITGPGPGGGPIVRIWDFAGGLGAAAQMNQFNAFDPNFRGGINVAIGSVVDLPNPNPLQPTVKPNITGAQITSVTFPFDPNVGRQFSAQIIVSTASGSNVQRVFADYNPNLSRRTSVTQLRMVPVELGDVLVQDLNNPLGNFTAVQTVTQSNQVIDPQFAGDVLSGVSALAFSVSDNGTATVVANRRAQQMAAPGPNPSNGQSRGTVVKIFDNLGGRGRVAASDPYYQPVDTFTAFTQGLFPNGVGGVAFGFGALPNPRFDPLELAPIAVTTAQNPILI